MPAFLASPNAVGFAQPFKACMAQAARANPVIDLALAGHSHGGGGATFIKRHSSIGHVKWEFNVERVIGLLGQADAGLVEMKLCRKRNHRVGFWLSKNLFEHIRPLFRNSNQRLRRARRLAPPLLPVLQRTHGYAQQFSELRL